MKQWKRSDQAPAVRGMVNENFGALEAALAALSRTLEEKEDGLAGQIGGVQTALTGRIAQVEELAESRARLAVGKYTGNGAESQFIALPFTPQAVHVEQHHGLRAYSTNYAPHDGLALWGSPMYLGSANSPIIGAEEGGFRVYCYEGYSGSNNSKGMVFYFTALK